MSIIKSTKMIFELSAVLILISFNSSTVLAGSGDPILETQSKAVPVTEETLKDEGRPGAPAPTFKLVHDTGIFFTKTPVETIEEEKLKKWDWLDESKDSDKEKRSSEEDSDISDY